MARHPRIYNGGLTRSSPCGRTRRLPPLLLPSEIEGRAENLVVRQHLAGELTIWIYAINPEIGTMAVVAIGGEYWMSKSKKRSCVSQDFMRYRPRATWTL
jgi:hypothetical protein